MKVFRKLILTVAAVALCAATLSAADKESNAITGKVAVTKNEAGKTESITLTAEDGTVYHIATSGKGTSISKECDGLTIEVTGSAKKKKEKGETEEAMWLTVKSYQLVFTGKVSVEKKGNLISKITLGEYEVKVDAKSKKMAADADGKEVVATGTKAKNKSKKEGEAEEIVTIKEYTLKKK